MVTVGTGCKEELGQYEGVVLRHGRGSFGYKKIRRSVCSASTASSPISMIQYMMNFRYLCKSFIIYGQLFWNVFD